MAERADGLAKEATCRRSGKQGDCARGGFEPTKRNVPLSTRALTGALLLLLQQPHSGVPGALLWPALAHGTHDLDWSRSLDTAAVRRHFMSKALVRLGMAPMRFHDLQCSYASMMFAAGFKPFEVIRWMGHASVSTTDGIYAHLYPSGYNEQIARFEADASRHPDLRRR